MKKNKIRLTESQLRKLVKKSVKSFINEGGHLTWKDDDGRMHTNSQDNWYGIEGATFVWHGEWSDGEIYFDYEGEQYVINANDAEEWLWTDFKEYCEENNLNPDEHSDDEIWYNFAKNEGYDVLLNLGPYNESYKINESKESAREYRRNSYAYTGGFSKGWDKGRQQMKEATADPKQRVKVSEAQLRQIIKESVNKVLQEGWFGNLFNRGANKKQQTQQRQSQNMQLPNGVYRTVKEASFGNTSKEWIPMYDIWTTTGHLYCNYHDVDINQIKQELQRQGIEICHIDDGYKQNPNWNGLKYDRKVEPKYGDWGGERADFTTLSWPSRM